MSRTAYYVVAVDLDTREVSVDMGTTMARFDERGEQVWDDATNEWRKFEGDECALAVGILHEWVND